MLAYSPVASTAAEGLAPLVARLAAMADPRQGRGKAHPLPGVPALVVLGLLADLAGYAVSPGLAQVAEPRTEVVRVTTGKVTRRTRYPVASLAPGDVAPADLLGVARRHRGIENRWFHVTDDGFGEDRRVLQTHHRGQVVGALRGTALNLLRGPCPLWLDATPLTARAEWVSGHPLIIFSGL